MPVGRTVGLLLYRGDSVSTSGRLQGVRYMIILQLVT